MSIKNAYVTSSMENILKDIQKTLVSHNAQKIMYEYDNGKVVGLTFGIKVGENEIGVKLPTKVKECELIMIKQRVFDRTKKDHSLRVAWANIRDWVSAQMAMIDLNMVKMEEVFLPYILDGDRTVYEIYQQKFTSLPESGGMR